MYQKLVEFKDIYGHCRVPQGWKEDPRLGGWVNTQRVLQSKGTLQPDREAKLNELQFTWRRRESMPEEKRWDASYQKLVEFNSRFGHCRVPLGWKEDPALGRWVNMQRILQSKGTLQPDREAKLNELQFTWGRQDSMPNEKKWDASYQKLVEFKTRFGHCRVPRSWEEDPRLGRWVNMQRFLQSKGTLQPDREAKLNELQFTCGRQEKKWDASYQKLVEFNSRFGHCRVPWGWKEDPRLGRWVNTQRILQSKGTLQPDREAKLNELQFTWRRQDRMPKEKKWDASYQKLVEFKTRFGHCRVPAIWKEDPRLGRWVNTQRFLQSKGTLQLDREAKLNELEFTWRRQDSMPKEKKWDASFQKLVEFNSRFGHCRVPVIWKEDPRLGRWLTTQRFLQSKGTLQPDREAKLNELQFTCGRQDSMPLEKKWDASYQKLVEFNSRFGHCRVPAIWKEDPPLGRWVARQRFLQSKGTLQPDRQAKLNELQFVWSENSRKHLFILKASGV